MTGPSPLGPGFTTAALQGYALLQNIWDSFAEAAEAVRQATGKPVCVDGCGLCCVANVPVAWGIEVTRAASWLHEQPLAQRTAILDRIENWLVSPVLEVHQPERPAYLERHPVLGKRSLDRANPVHQLQLVAAMRGRCPLLGDDLRCSVYEVRPLGCRAWGITTAAESFCQRPRGLGESGDQMVVAGGHGTARLRAQIRGVLEAVKSEPRLTNNLLFPTGLFAQFREARLVELLPHIPTARLMMGHNVIGPRLFQDPLDAPLPKELFS